MDRVVRVHSTTALKTVLDVLGPSFTRATGIEIATQFGPSGRMTERVAEGETTDVAIVTSTGIDDLVAQRCILPGQKRDIALSRIGVAVAAGAARPDIRSPEAFKRAMLAARAVAMSHPTGGAQSGAHLARVFDRLGIASSMAGKLIYGPGGPAGLIGNFLLRGEADIGVQQMPELMAVPGIDIVGPLPDELQLVTLFSAGISTGAVNPADCFAWIEHLTSPEAGPVIVRNGLEPPVRAPK
jgi:molybdate transport system substrate-binding protein